MSGSGRRVFLWGATLSIPFLALAAAELSFRALGLFSPEPLLIAGTAGSVETVGFNPAAARRYFDESSTALPLLTPEVFPRQKSPSTFRILCLGESTTAGFPFDCQVPFPVQLRELLSRAYPSRRIEVLNAGVAAIGSAVVLDMLPELLDGTNPDLVIVYLGHNEFYGIFGSASTLSPALGTGFTRVALWLRGLHLTQLTRRVVAMLPHGPGPAWDDRTLMQQVVRDRNIPLNSPLYHSTTDAFRANLGRILSHCHEAHVPAIVGTLVSNERDLPPFQEGGCEEDGGLDLMLTADSMCADAWFAEGRALLLKGDSSRAAQCFRRARDLDGVRFRATEEFNQVIRDAAKLYGSGLTDLAEIFRRSSPGGVIGNQLICDHLHPNPLGYYLMATSFYRTLLSMNLLPSPDSSFALSPAPYGVTDLDWDIGLLKIHDMVHRWPYRPRTEGNDAYRPHGDTAAARVASDYLFVNNVWSRAHEAMAQLHLRRGNPALARREYEAIAVFSPDDPWPHEAIARLYEQEADWANASRALHNALQRSPRKGLIAYRLAISEWRQGNLGEAIAAMDIAVRSPELSRSERQNALFYLAGFLSDGGRPDRAREVLREILTDDPTFVPARIFLQRLSRIRP